MWPKKTKNIQDFLWCDWLQVRFYSRSQLCSLWELEPQNMSFRPTNRMQTIFLSFSQINDRLFVSTFLLSSVISKTKLDSSVFPVRRQINYLGTNFCYRASSCVKAKGLYFDNFFSLAVVKLDNSNNFSPFSYYASSI